MDEEEEQREKEGGRPSWLTAEREAELRFLFNLADRDGGGTIEKEEVTILLKKVGIDASQNEIDYWLEGNDTDGSGSIDFGEFCEAFGLQARNQQIVTSELSKRKMLEAFRIFEGANVEGKIHPRVLLNALVEFGAEDSSITIEEAAELIKSIQSEIGPDGLIDYQAIVDKVYSYQD